MSGDNAGAIFHDLKALLTPYQSRLVLVHDSADHYYLDTAFLMPNKKPLFFAAAKISKAYVSFHLMPVYVFPDLLDEMPAALRARMQGKSCFNFTTLTAEQRTALQQLVARSVERYRAQGYLN